MDWILSTLPEVGGQLSARLKAWPERPVRLRWRLVRWHCFGWGGFRRFSLGGRIANLARLVVGRAVMGPPGLKLISNFSRCLTPFPGIHETLAGHYMYHLSPRDVSSLFFIGRATLVANSKIKTKNMLKKKVS